MKRILTTAILAATLVASEFAYNQYCRIEIEAVDSKFKLLLFANALRSTMPQPPAVEQHKRTFPGDAHNETL